MPKPIIGVTIDAEPPGGFSERPWFAVRRNYCESVSDAGGIPVLLPHFDQYAEDYVAGCQAIMVIGGKADVPPELYGEKAHPKVTTKPARTAFEMKLVAAALAQNKPVLGICGGMQLLNVVLGGTLVQHIPDLNGDIDHMQKTRAEEPQHKVLITPGTLLHKICGVAEADINSSHHQSVRSVADGTIINAAAPDGVVEGIESSRHKFCLGVQWHPEYAASPIDGKIMRAFCDAAK